MFPTFCAPVVLRIFFLFVSNRNCCSASVKFAAQNPQIGLAHLGTVRMVPYLTMSKTSHRCLRPEGYHITGSQQVLIVVTPPLHVTHGRTGTVRVHDGRASLVLASPSSITLSLASKFPSLVSHALSSQVK